MKVLALSGLALSMLTAMVTAAPLYSVTDLGTLGGSSSAAIGINDSGQVVGYAPTIAGDEHAFFYSNGVMTDLGTLGGTFSKATAINAGGQVVGYSSGMNGYQHAFIYSNGVMTDLGTLGGPESNATGINESGQVVGFSGTNPDGSITRAFRYNGSMIALGTLGGTVSAAFAINSSGWVVGNSTTAGNAAVHGFLYNGATMVDLGTLGGSSSHATGVNANALVVGFSTATNGTEHAFVFDHGAMRDLGTLGGPSSYAHGINSRGQVVGNSAAPDGLDHAFLYDGSMVDLNTLIDPMAGWSLTTARAINETGQIVGVGRVGGNEHAYLLTRLSPVPVLPAAIDDGPIPVIEAVEQGIPVGANDVGFINPVRVTVTTAPTKGSITAMSPPGPAAGMTITYVANIGAVGADSFVYEMTDSTPASDLATVTLTISPDTDGDAVADPNDNCKLIPNTNQLDTNGDGYGNICDADLNDSGAVTTADYGLLRSVLGRPASFSALAAAADMNGSGTVTTTDFGLLRARLGTAPGPSGLHP